MTSSTKSQDLAAQPHRTWEHKPTVLGSTNPQDLEHKLTGPASTNSQDLEHWQNFSQKFDWLMHEQLSSHGLPGWSHGT